MQDHKHYIKLREDGTILDGFSDAFKNIEDHPGYIIHEENQGRYFNQMWLDEYGYPLFKKENGEIIPREKTQAELDEIEAEKAKQAVISENVELLAIYDFIENGSIRPALQTKVRAKVQALKAELPS